MLFLYLIQRINWPRRRYSHPVVISDYYQNHNIKDMIWQDYFECRIKASGDSDFFTYYAYKDRHVKRLPDNLPMPPTDTFYMMFYNCPQLEDISALANWDVSNVRDMRFMFCGCRLLKDITALSNWNVSDVTDIGCMFARCSQLRDNSIIAKWMSNM